ncbi:NAD(P)/FAD-dependent oxidoreductase [Lysinibacillus parviboronicapiens]|uniref:NAD(P)/FAD-dependent oxidoreductase n=1 Tax=Lysinibacillus parviboronicapiens TaxID=436516 RepID=UPI000D39F9EB|nr:FAD-dependent oxidoreductase [Lysinibacillus parviboronicapiens]
MKIHSGTLYWPTTIHNELSIIKNPIAPYYEVIIIGGGISGFLTAHACLEAGLKVALIEKNDIAKGSTVANTGILHFSNDMMLHELIDQIGEKDAVRFYRMCYEAIQHIETITNTLPDQADFRRRQSICFASKTRDASKLLREFNALHTHGFPCEYWNDIIIKERLGFEKEGALVTFNDAEINPVKFVQALAEQCQQRGLHIFTNIMVNVLEDMHDSTILHTINGQFTTRHLIFATGYQHLPYGQLKGSDFKRSYTIVTNSIDNFKPWYEHSLIWETKRPYLYMRTTPDNRIIIGGLDEDKAKVPKSEEKLEKQSNKLLASLHELFPHFNVKIDYSYCATFGDSIDCLPFIGEHPDHPRYYYLLGYGGNGTVYSMIGANIITDLLKGVPNDDARIVTLARKNGIK